MKYFNQWLVSLFLILTATCFSQKSDIYTNSFKDYNHALELYNNRDFMASKHLFNRLKASFDDSSELKGNSEYYEAFSTIQLGDQDGDQMMRDFVERYPTSTKQNTAFLEVGDYYFKNANYPYSLKWYNRVETRNLSLAQEEEYNFKYAYGLFAVRSYKRAKEFFQKILNSYRYGSQAKYYYGFIAYQQDDYENANRYLNEISDDKEFGKDVPYYMANIKFKTGNFKEAIKIAEPFLDKADKNQHSEISKIIGESYFNLKQYDKAIPHLKNYKGKRRRWNNTDYYMLGYAYYKQAEYENAISFFNKIISGDNAVSQNAYYHLAECYLKTDQKTEALNAFRNASQMDFDNDIKKDAWLNYAKLSYEIGNPYTSVPEVLKAYLENYPKSKSRDEIEELLIGAYISTNDYEGALKELKNKKNSNNSELYQKVALYRGIELFNEGQLNDAKVYFDLAIDEPKDRGVTARSIFWNAETDYLLNDFESALVGYQQFEAMGKTESPSENDILNYNLAYVYFKLKDYTHAGEQFKIFIDLGLADKNMIDDSYLRLGDVHFVSSDYNKAINSYNKVINARGISADYAHFQRAMSYGYQGDNSKKIVDLVKFLSEYQKSTLRDDAYFELGNAYVKAEKNDRALEAFDDLIDNYKRSSFVPKAILNQGLIYYNSERDNQALNKYTIVVKKYPNTDEAKQAVANARQIYVDLGRVDEYADWVSGIDFVSITDADLDNDMYESAEKQYLQNNKSKAINAFKKYVERFPKGLHALQANFYLAEVLFAEHKLPETEKYYGYVIAQERNEYTEQALSKLAQVYLESDNWNSAMPILERLEEQADFRENIIFSQSNLMKGYYELENYKAAVIYAEKVLGQPKIENRIKSDAKVIIARSAFKTGELYRAQDAYKEVEKIAQGELMAESIYYDAYFKNNEGNYKVSNAVVKRLVADYSTYKYYGAKGMIVMAKNFYELKDAFQATYILESVIKNFRDYKDVVDEAKAELKRIKTEEAKTNESVDPNEN
jgi:TolA-binding protein